MTDDHSLPTPDAINSALAPESDELSNLTPEERAVAAKVIPMIAKKANADAEANKAKELSRLVDELRQQNSKMMADELDKLRAANKPPDAAELQKLLDQDYGTLTVKLRDKNGDSLEREFVIAEMPLASEKKLVKILQQKLVPHMKLLSSVEWTTGSSTAEKIQSLIDVVPDALDILAEACAVSLDPYGDRGITPEWVKENMSAFRIMTVVQAQMEVGRIRDFFSRLWSTIPSTLMD